MERTFWEEPFESITLQANLPTKTEEEEEAEELEEEEAEEEEEVVKEDTNHIINFDFYFWRSSCLLFDQTSSYNDVWSFLVVLDLVEYIFIFL